MTTIITPTITAAPLPWPVLRDLLEAAGAEGRIPAVSVPALRSTLRGACLDLVLQRQAAPDRDAAGALLDVTDLTPYLEHAVEAARLAAKRAGHRRPGNAAARVGQALAAALPDTFGEGPVVGKLRAALLGAPWRPLVVALEGHAQEDGLTHYVCRLAEVVWTKGIDGPCGLPPTADAAADLLLSAGVDAAQSIPKMIYAYRVATRALLAQGTPVLGAPAWKERRTARLGVRRIGGVAEAPEDALKATLPYFAYMLNMWRAGPATELRAGTRDAYEGSFFRTAALVRSMGATGMLRTPLHRLEPLHLWEQRVPNPRLPDQPAELNDGILLFGPRLGAAAEDAVRAHGEVALAEAVGYWAVVSEQVKRRTASGRAFFVPHAVATDLANVWHMARAVYEGPIRKSGKSAAIADFDQAIATRSEVAANFAVLRASAGDPHAKDKQKAIAHCTLPLLTCVVLPYWTLVELPRLRARLDAYARRLPDEHGVRSTYDARTEQARRNDYTWGLESWALQAVLAADPLRRAQLVYGRAGREYRVDADWADDGSLVRVTAVSSHFHGRGWPDNSEASLKQAHLGERTWVLSPSTVDYEWFATYLRDVWHPRLRARGLIAADTSLREAMESGAFALFVPSTGGETGNRWRGYSKGYLSTRFAEAFRQSLIALGYEVPELRAASANGWGFILGPHVFRLFWASFWLGLRGNAPLHLTLPNGVRYELSGLDIVKRATTDGERALRRDYTVVLPTMQELERTTAGTWRHPRAYDTLMDRAYMVSETVDWRAAWTSPDFPLPDHLREAFRRAAVRPPAVSGAEPGRRRRRGGGGAG